MTNIGKIRLHKPKPQTGRQYRAPWYDTRQWRNMREQHLSQHPLCVECEKKGIVSAATVLDHVIPVSSYPEDKRERAFWDGEKQGLCKYCHNSKSARETRGKDAHNRLLKPNEDL